MSPEFTTMIIGFLSLVALLPNYQFVQSSSYFQVRFERIAAFIAAEPKKLMSAFPYLRTFVISGT